MNLRAISAFLKRDLLINISYKSAFAFDTLSILSTLMTFFFISRIFSPGMSPHLQAYQTDYFSFVLIGLVLSGFQASMLSGWANTLNREQETGTLEALLMAPLKLSDLFLAACVSQGLMTFLRALLYLGIGIFIFNASLSFVHAPEILLILILTTTSLAGLGLISAGFILAFKRGDPVSYFVSTLSKLMGGVYFPVAVLPVWIQGLCWILPFAHALEALRKLAFQGASFRDISSELMLLAIFSLVLTPLGLAFFRWALRKAKREGSLVFY